MMRCFRFNGSQEKMGGGQSQSGETESVKALQVLLSASRDRLLGFWGNFGERVKKLVKECVQHRTCIL